MKKSSSDLVCVFDIESGIWAGDTSDIQLPDDKASDLINKLFRLYDQEFIVKDSRKITIPRYVSVGLMPWDVFSHGCYEDPEYAFLYKIDRYDFLLSEEGIDTFLSFWKDILDYCQDKGNVLLFAHNANYDINGILFSCKSDHGNRLINMTREYIDANKGTYLAFPESIHDDKTFDIKLGNNHIRLVDTINISPSGCKSLAKWGDRASSMYNKDYHKGDSYDYDYKIYSRTDIPPSEEELHYTNRDLQLCLFSAMMAIYSYRRQLMGRGARYYATDFPFSATQRDKAVNDGLTIQTENPDGSKTEWKQKFRNMNRSFKRFCERWGNAKDEKTYQLFKKASTGGIITCNESYVNKITEDVGSMDLGSSYPSSAGDFLFPNLNEENGYTGYMTKEMFDLYLQNILKPLANELRSGTMQINSPCVNNMHNIGLRIGFVCKVRFHMIRYHDFGCDSNGIRYWLPILPYKDFDENVNKEDYTAMRGKVVMNKTLEYYCTHIGLAIILAFYDIEEIEFLEGFSYEMKMINPIIHSRFRSGLVGKQNAKKIRKAWYSGNISDDEMIELTGMTYLKGQSRDTMKSEIEAWYSASKVPANAMYGANYRKLIRDQRVVLEDGRYALKGGDYDPATAVAYPTGLYIAIYGQLKIAHAILWAMHKRLPILYVHTDSLKIQGLTPGLVEEYNKLIVPPKWTRNEEPVSFQETFGIGKMDYEGSHDLAIVIGNMRIISWDKDGGYSITMSGLNERKAFPKEVIGNMEFKDFVTTYLADGKRYAVDEDTASGKIITDFSGAGLYIKGIGYTMQSLVDAEFILNNPKSIRQTIIRSVDEVLLGEYHGADYYAQKGLIIHGKQKEI